MKKSIRILIYLLGTLLSLALLTVLLFLLRPTLLINPRNIAFALERSQLLEDWSWSDAEIDHHWNSWRDRRLSGRFQHLCLSYAGAPADLKTCIEELSWNFNLRWTWGRGLRSHTIDPVKLRSKELSLTLKEAPEKKTKDSSVPDLRGHWGMLWADFFPDLDVRIETVSLKRPEENLETDLIIFKKGTHLIASAFDLELVGHPQGFQLEAPSPFMLPKDFGLQRPLALHGILLTGDFEERGLRLRVRGAVERSPFKFATFVALPLKGSFDSLALRKQVALASSGELRLENLKRELRRYAPKPFNILPAPLNVLDGEVEVKVSVAETERPEVVAVKTPVAIDLSGPEQALRLQILPNLLVDLNELSFAKISLGLNFEEVRIKLPRLSKKELPPQMRPDARIKFAHHEQKEQAREKPKTPVEINLHAQGAEALQIQSNLLDEPLRLNLDLSVVDSALAGVVQTLPLNTSVFRRSVYVPGVRVKFQPPLEPELNAQVVFLLPDYKITLQLEGPLSGPRHFFSSEPPLPQSDIIAVLFFGRPMRELAPEDQSEANRSQQILSQGLLSLSVLYFLAGSPIESIGYDAETKGVSAQVGLGRRSSLKVGNRETGVRHSLGKGWYIDTSASSKGAGSGGSYGVLLERIIAF